jgi:signal transduction histidine kinase
MPALGVFLIYAAILLRTAVVVSDRPEYPAVMTLLAAYGLLLAGETWLKHRKRSRYLHSQPFQLAYLLSQSILVVSTLILSSYEDFIGMLFIPVSLEAVSLFGRRAGFLSIALFSLVMIVTLLFSDVGRLFGLVMGSMYAGICFLVGGYADQVEKATAAHRRNEQMYNELQAAHRQLQGYADQVASLAIEHERNRLARELHDSVTQTVFSMNLAAQSAHLLMQKDPPRATGQLLRIEELAASALREIQSLVSQLKPRPIAEMGFLPASERLLA